jgi:hypothetical protein
VTSDAIPWEFYQGLAVIEWNIQPSEFWRMTLQEFWMLLDFKNGGGSKPKPQGMKRARFEELKRADEERERLKRGNG